MLRWGWLSHMQIYNPFHILPQHKSLFCLKKKPYLCSVYLCPFYFLPYLCNHFVVHLSVSLYDLHLEMSDFTEVDLRLKEQKNTKMNN